MPPHPGHQSPHRHHHADGPVPGDGQGHGPDERGRRLCDQALLPGGADRPGGRPDPPQRRRQPRAPGGHHQPAPLPAEHTQPHPGEKRPAHQADPGGVFHHADVYGKSRQGPVPGGDPGPGVGPGLFRRAEDRGRQRPPSAAEDRGQRHQPHLYHHGVGLWL